MSDGSLLEDCTLTLSAEDPPVRAGIRCEIWALPGATILSATDGAILHLAPGAHLEDLDPGLLERAQVTVTTWDGVTR